MEIKILEESKNEIIQKGTIGTILVEIRRWKEEENREKFMKWTVCELINFNGKGSNGKLPVSLPFLPSFLPETLS